MDVKYPDSCIINEGLSILEIHGILHPATQVFPFPTTQFREAMCTTPIMTPMHLRLKYQYHSLFQLSVRTAIMIGT